MVRLEEVPGGVSSKKPETESPLWAGCHEGSSAYRGSGGNR